MNIQPGDRVQPFWMRHPRSILSAFTLVTTALATWLFVRVIAGDGLGLADIPLVALFSILFLWVSFSFWTATLGLITIMRGPRPDRDVNDAQGDSDRLPRTAVLMPIYNEDLAACSRE